AVPGAPHHLGLPGQNGIADQQRPEYGDPVPLHEGEMPVFWACGVTPQSVLMAAKPPLAITHSPGCMFVTDLKDEQLAVG
ncbi:MAG: D-glutamate cyclase family protein, partial [Planctomycetaceae bacterium]